MAVDDDAKVMKCMEVWGGNHKTDTSIVMPGLDAWVYSEPWEHETAGGDVHYLSSCASGQIVRMLVADVSGHGSSVADTALHLRSIMRRHVNDHDQLRFVRSLNREFTAASTNGLFATAVAMTFDSPTNRMMVCNAGHPPPLWYRSEQKKWTFLKQSDAGAANVPWGIVVGVDYDQFTVQLRMGDVVVAYTDSLIEARIESGEMIGMEGLLKLANALGPPDAGRLVPRLLGAIDDRGKDSLSRDDVTCLVIRPNGSRPRIPFTDNLLAPFRFIAALGGKHFGWIGATKFGRKNDSTGT